MNSIEEKLKKSYKRIEDDFVDHFLEENEDGDLKLKSTSIEKKVVSMYKKIEDTTVSNYKKIEDKFVDTFLKKQGGDK